MSYTKSISILSLMLSLAVSTIQSTPTSAYTEDMSAREVEALLLDRMDYLSKRQVHALTLHLIRLCKQHHFAVSSVLSVIAAESGFKMDAVSPVGAIGLMQLMPATAGFISRKAKLRGYHGSEDLYDPKTNVSVGVTYLSYLRERYVQSHGYLAAYNLGPTKYNRIVKRRAPKPESVRRYIKAVHSGVYRIRRDAQQLAYNQYGGTAATASLATR